MISSLSSLLFLKTIHVAETYDRKESLNYFQKYSSHECNNCEPSSLVGITSCDSSISFKRMMKEEIHLYLLTTKCLSSLTRHQRDEHSLLWNVKNERHKKYIHHTIINTLNIIRTRLASDDNDFICWYVCEVRSICNNLPCPNISMLNNHTYISVRHYIVDYLGKGNLPSTIPSKSS